MFCILIRGKCFPLVRFLVGPVEWIPLAKSNFNSTRGCGVDQGQTHSKMVSYVLVRTFRALKLNVYIFEYTVYFVSPV